LIAVSYSVPSRLIEPAEFGSAFVLLFIVAVVLITTAAGMCYPYYDMNLAGLGETPLLKASIP
jgi:hypothetical protein